MYNFYIYNWNFKYNEVSYDKNLKFNDDLSLIKSVVVFIFVI